MQGFHFHMTLTRKIFSTAALGLALAGSAAGATIDTTPSANSNIIYFGETDTTTYGQTFRAPSPLERTLDRFSFYLDHTGGGEQSFRGYVMAWNEALGQTTGSVLFTSSVRTLGVDVGSNFIEFEIATGGLTLAPDQDYVAFLSTSGLFNGQVDSSAWQSVSGTDPYSEGHFVFHNSDGVFPGPGVTWNCGASCAWQLPGGDLSFKMSFSNGAAVPAPGSVALVLMGLVGIWRRQRSLA